MHSRPGWKICISKCWTRKRGAGQAFCTAKCVDTVGEDKGVKTSTLLSAKPSEEMQWERKEGDVIE